MESQDRSEVQRESSTDAYASLLDAGRRMRRRFFVILAILAGVVVLMVGVLLILYFALPEGETEASPEISFFEPYGGDIFESAEYLALDRSISYFDGYVYRSIEAGNEDGFDRSVLFLRDFIGVMTRGDAAAYNAAFTESPRQAEFSQQMIYAATVAYEGESVDGGDRILVYRLEYKIHRNDGTLRRDVGSDGMRPQWAVVRVTDGGEVSLDSLTLIKP